MHRFRGLRALYTLFIGAVTIPVILNAAKSFRQIKIESSPTRSFPWRGWNDFKPLDVHILKYRPMPVS